MLQMREVPSPFERYLPEIHAVSHPLPEGKETPFCWPAVRLDSEGCTLRWQQPLSAITEFRFTIAIDLRAALVVELVLAKSGYRIGLCDVQYGYPLQTFEIKLHAGLEEAIAREGLRLRVLEGACELGELWVLAAGEPSGSVPAMLAPHLVGARGQEAPADLWEQSFETLCSPASLQVFGWLEGCVLEGLHELAVRVPEWKARAEEAIRGHLDHFLLGPNIVYICPRSMRTENRWFNNEHGLMVPSLLRYRPEHPSIALFADHWIDSLRGHVVELGRNLSCEGCYTLAYPIALLGQQRGESELVELALDVLLLHRRYLKEGDTLYLQYTYSEGARIYPFWLRGVAWYLLGHVRVLALARQSGLVSPRIAEVEQELQSVIATLLKLQGEEGLWACFAAEPATGEETSGSAGIAAAFLLAVEMGYAGAEAKEAALRVFSRLEDYLSPDGLLAGVSQSNKIEAGEALQRYGFRCRSQMGQGLAVQLAAIALDLSRGS